MGAIKRGPDFIISGAPRSGSTYLLENLSCHPDIFFPKNQGEHGTGDIHFFDIGREEGRRNFDKGMDWYLSKFEGAKSSDLTGEKTADYLADRDAPRLIKRCFPGVKVVVVLRDPVDRALSHFWHERHNLLRFDNFDDFLSYGKDYEDAHVISSGLYYESLCKYLEVFDASSIKIIISDEMHAQPAVVLADICSFLGVREDFCFPYSDRKINVGNDDLAVGQVRRISGWLARRCPKVYSWLRETRFANLVKSYVARRRGVSGYEAVGAVKARSRYPIITVGQKEKLKDFYRDDVVKLGGLLGKDMIRYWWGE